MTRVAHVHEDNLIRDVERALAALTEGAARFPALVVETVEDDGEVFDALRCPRCKYLIDGDLFAVSIDQNAIENEELYDSHFDHRQIPFDPDVDRDLGDTIYYRHGDNPGHAVRLPDGWRESWL